MSNNFSTIEEAVQAALDKQTLQCMCGRDYIDVQCTTLAGVLNLMHNLHWSNFRIKPEKKTINYQTRLYETDDNGIQLWVSLYCASQTLYEQSPSNLKWLEPTQERTCEYEVK